jgi:hypothetical protein
MSRRWLQEQIREGWRETKEDVRLLFALWPLPWILALWITDEGNHAPALWVRLALSAPLVAGQARNLWRFPWRQWWERLLARSYW